MYLSDCKYDFLFTSLFVQAQFCLVFDNCTSTYYIVIRGAIYYHIPVPKKSNVGNNGTNYKIMTIDKYYFSMICLIKYASFLNNAYL